MDAVDTARGGLERREENLARRIRYEMNRRGWSQERMAAEMTKAGLPLHQSAISKIINTNERGKRRTISVDEALVFSKVFEIPLEALLLPVAVAKSHELKLITERISTLSDEWSEIIQEVGRLWSRAGELLGDEEVVDTYADQLIQEGMTRAGAVKHLMGWLEGAEARYASTRLRAKAFELGVEYREFSERQLKLVEEALDLIENTDKYDANSIEKWFAENSDDITSYWLAQTTISEIIAARRDDTDRPNLKKLTVESVRWLRQIRESMIREMKRGGQVHDTWALEEGGSKSEGT